MSWWIRRPIHSSWRIAVASCAFVTGVAVAPVLTISSWIGLVVAPMLLVLLTRKQFGFIILTFFISLLLGVSFGSAHSASRDAYTQFIGMTVEVSGRVKEDITKSSSGKYSIQLENIRVGSNSFPGTLLVTSRQTGGALRGDEMTLRGEVKEKFGSFPATLSALSVVQVTRREWSDPGRVARDAFAAQVREVVPDPQASLGIGFLTGQKSALPSDLAESLKIAGLTHIVVASGYNLTILVRMARKLFLKVSKYLSAVASGVMIASFMTITGLSPSMTRAGLVSSLSLLAWYYGHAFHPFVLLPFAAAITVALQPSYVWGDLGWQLSFAAFAGVMIVAPLLQKYFFGNKEPGVLRQVLGETVAAHIVTLPLIALSFGVVSNVAVIANLLVVPLVPLAMLLTFICGLWNASSLPFVELIGTPTTWLLVYMTNVATFVSELSWAQSEVPLNGWLWAVYAAGIVLACFWMQRATRYSFRGNEPLMG